MHYIRLKYNEGTGRFNTETSEMITDYCQRYGWFKQQPFCYGVRLIFDTIEDKTEFVLKWL